jgi:hypothetical protein
MSAWRLILSTLVFCAGGAMFAQSDAELGGTVRDSSGALIPDVAVTVTKLDTQMVRTSVSNEAGFFLVPLLPPGTYQLRLTKAGFKPATQTGIILQVGQQARLDITLELGAVVEEVTITAQTPLLETASATRGQVIDNQKIVGAGRVPAGRQDSFSASGQRAYEINYQLDGVDNNTMQRASQARRGEVIKPSVDAIQEFKVLTSAYSAEHGRAGGGIINVNLKSGTNQFHGTVFEFLRNEALDAKNFFDPAGKPKPPFKRNQYGGSPLAARFARTRHSSSEITRPRESANQIPC